MDSKDRLARPERVEGLYVYVMSEPMDDYEILGRIDGGLLQAGDMKGSASRIAKKARKKYPNAQGMIFDERNYNAALIKFKD